MFRRSRTAEIGLGAKAWPIGSVHSPPQLPTPPLLDPPCLTPFLEKQYRGPWNFLNELAGTDLSEAQRHLQRHKDLACSLHTAGDRVLSNWVWFQFSQNTCSTPPHRITYMHALWRSPDVYCELRVPRPERASQPHSRDGTTRTLSDRSVPNLAVVFPTEEIKWPECK